MGASDKLSHPRCFVGKPNILVVRYGEIKSRRNLCRAFDSFAPAHSACGPPVCVAGVPAAPLCETPIE